MAEHLASIYGTEKDKVNCSFYFKIGACRHGEKCSRKHVKPTFSQTLLLPNMYHNPAHDPNCPLSLDQLQQHFDLFYEDVYVELCKYGELEEMKVCDNVGDHLVGNVYARFAMEEEAGRAVEELNKRFYAGRPLYAELSPVTDFKESCCRQHDNGECNRGGFCNFMHLRHPAKELLTALQASQDAFLREQRRAKTDPGRKATSPPRRKNTRSFGQNQHSDDRRYNNDEQEVSRGYDRGYDRRRDHREEPRSSREEFYQEDYDRKHHRRGHDRGDDREYGYANEYGSMGGGRGSRSAQEHFGHIYAPPASIRNPVADGKRHRE